MNLFTFFVRDSQNLAREKNVHHNLKKESKKKIGIYTAVLANICKEVSYEIHRCVPNSLYP